MPRLNRPADARIAHLEDVVADLLRWTQTPANSYRAGWRPPVRLAKTAKDATSDAYPARPAKLFPIVFVDATFDATKGDSDLTKNDRTAKATQTMYALNGLYYPEGTLVSVFCFADRWYTADATGSVLDLVRFELKNKLNPGGRAKAKLYDATPTSYTANSTVVKLKAFLATIKGEIGARGYGEWRDDIKIDAKITIDTSGDEVTTDTTTEIDDADPVQFMAVGGVVNVTIDTSSDQLTLASDKNISTKTQIYFAGGTLPTVSPAVSLAGVFYARKIDGTHITLHPTESDANSNSNKLNFTAAGSGVSIKYVGRLPTTSPEIDGATTYWAHRISGTVFTIHETEDDAKNSASPIDFQDTGSGEIHMLQPRMEPIQIDC